MNKESKALFIAEAKNNILTASLQSGTDKILTKTIHCRIDLIEDFKLLKHKTKKSELSFSSIRCNKDEIIQDIFIFSTDERLLEIIADVVETYIDILKRSNIKNKEVFNKRINFRGKILKVGSVLSTKFGSKQEIVVETESGHLMFGFCPDKERKNLSNLLGQELNLAATLSSLNEIGFSRFKVLKIKE